MSSERFHSEGGPDRSKADLETLRDSLAESQKRHLDPKAPMPAKMMAAKGVLPLPPRDMVIVLCGLSLDDTNEVAEAAKNTLGTLPDKLISAAIDAELPASALEILAPLVALRDALVEKLVLDKNTPDEVISSLAADVSGAIAEIIVGNQERCLRSAGIVRSVARNESLLRSSRDRLFDFLVRSGVIYEDMPEFAEAIARLSPTEMHEATEKVSLPPEVALLTQDDNSEDDEWSEATREALESDNPDAKERIPILKQIAMLSVSQRVALAFRGNKEARTLLLRDANRVIAGAAVRNPRITEQEVVSAAQSRSVCDEVIRIISGSKELSRAYGVKVALVNNPKTPLPTAMRMLSLLREADVRAVAKSKNVSTAVCNQARRLIAQKKH